MTIEFFVIGVMVGFILASLLEHYMHGLFPFKPKKSKSPEKEKVG